jgi:hypothetical protein
MKTKHKNSIGFNCNAVHVSFDGIAIFMAFLLETHRGHLVILKNKDSVLFPQFIFCYVYA